MRTGRIDLWPLSRTVRTVDVHCPETRRFSLCKAKSINAKQRSPPPPAKLSGASREPKARASTLELKTINEVWDEKAYKYTIEESPKSVDESNELD
ncbi:hypothetical protein V8E51_004995 [Hyaloscypha variabilis]